MAVDQLQSITTEQLQDFEDWSSATSSDGCLGDWSDFHDGRILEGDRPASPVHAQSTEPLEHSSKSTTSVQSGDALNVWGVFRECFPAEDLPSEHVDLDTPTLSELLRSPSHTQPQPGDISSAAGVCGRLLCEGSSVRLSGPKPCLHSVSQLINTLPLVDPKTHNTEDMTLPDMELEKIEDPPAKLIQTKLLAPSCCHKSSSCCHGSPPILYQVSLRWLRQCNIQFQAHTHGKGFLQ